MPKVHKPQDRIQALDRYYEITDELGGLYAELATAQESELRTKSNTWISYQQNSVTERDRYSTHASIDFSAEIMQLKSIIQSLQEERVYLDRMLTHAF